MRVAGLRHILSSLPPPFCLPRESGDLRVPYKDPRFRGEDKVRDRGQGKARDGKTVRNIYTLAAPLLILLGAGSWPAAAAVTSISANFSQGAVVVGPNSTSCTVALAGAIRFMSGSPGVLSYCDGSTSGWVTISGGTAAPAGSNTYIQFNSGGVLGASANYTYDIINNIMSLANSGTGALRTGSGTLSLPGHSFAASTNTGMFMSGVGTALDFSIGGVEGLQLGTAASGVNYMKMTPTVAGAAPTLTNPGSDTNGAGLGLTVTGKTASATGDGGPITVTGGTGSGANAGGAITLTGGTPGATGAGGAVTVTAANGGATSGNGGSVTLQAGSVTSGTIGSILHKLGATTYMTVQPPGATAASVVFNGSDAVTLPSGTTAQRPTAGLGGMMRYNTTTSKFEAYQAGDWTNVVATALALDDLTDAKTNYTGVGSTSTASKWSMFIGVGVGANAAAGAQYNTGFGIGALQSLTTGTDNTAFGYLTLNSVTTASYNTAGGSRALAANTANYNTAGGYRALTSNTSGTRNTAVGANALAANTIGTDLTALGYNALASNVDGNYNTAAGSYALASNVSGSYNTAIGYLAMGSATGNYNTALGWKAMGSGVGGDSNTVMGALAFNASGFTGSRNTGIGYGVGQSVTSGSDNVFIGYMTGTTTTTGSSNILIGNNLSASAAGASNELNLGSKILGTLGGSNYIKLDTNQHMNYSGTVPTLGACGAGTAPTIVGNDNEFMVTRGGTAGTTCVINFANSWTNNPHCIASSSFSSTQIFISAISTSSITITNASNASGKLYVMCRGYL